MNFYLEKSSKKGLTKNFLYDRVYAEQGCSLTTTSSHKWHLFCFCNRYDCFIALEKRPHVRRVMIMNKGVHLGQSPECRLFSFVIGTMNRKKQKLLSAIPRNEGEK